MTLETSKLRSTCHLHHDSLPHLRITVRFPRSRTLMWPFYHRFLDWMDLLAMMRQDPTYHCYAVSATGL